MISRPSRLIAPLLLAPVLAGGFLVASPSVQARDGGAISTVAREVAGAVERERTFALPIAASHVALHWHGQPDARVTAAFTRDGEVFGAATQVLLDEIGVHRGNGESYGSVMLAEGATHVRVTSDRPLARLTVLAMDSSGSGTAAWGFGTATAAATQPAVITRAGWGANEAYRHDSSGAEIWRRDFFPIQKLIVHHTAGVNDDPNPPATIRSIYYYHAVTQGWGDIGYNFVIDEAGRIYEGRFARQYATGETPTGENQAGEGVTGGHALGFNAGTMGVALLGTLSSRDTTAAARDALERLLAWKAERHGIDPLGSSTYINPIDGTRAAFPNIAGHRDVNSTECPGSTFYGTLAGLRTAVYNRVDPPELVSRSPGPSVTNVFTGTTVDVTFSEPVTGVSSGTFYLRDTTTWGIVAAGVSYDSATASAVLGPSAALVGGRTYRVEMSGSIRDLSGNSLPWAPWTFTTDGTAPRLAWRSPGASATNIFTGTTVDVTFTEPVRGISSGTFYLRDTETRKIVSAAVSYDAATVSAVLRPAAALVRGRTYRVEMSGSIRDLSGNSLPWAPWTFTTDGTAPRLSTRSPGASATNVVTSTSVNVTFSEVVTGVSSRTFYLRDTTTWGIVAAGVSYDAATASAVLRPSAALARGRSYRVELSGSIRDLSGNSLPWAPWTFTTDGTAPALVSRSPGAGAKGVAVTTTVRVVFSEAVTGVSAGTFYLRDAATWKIVSATVSYDAATRTAVLRPSASLARGHAYRVELSGSIRDLSGNSLPWRPWKFATAP